MCDLNLRAALRAAFFILFFPAIAVVTLAATAQDATEPDEAEDAVVLRPAPDYFVQTVVATTTAQQIARSCRTLSLNLATVQPATTALLQRLDSDGFDISRADAGMEEPTDRFTALQEAFLVKHGLSEGIGEDEVCAAGRAEIDEGTEIGTYLTVVE